MENLRYPIGKFQSPTEIEQMQIDEWIKDIEELPGLLRKEVENLDSTQLDTPYRPEGWTVRQVVHHLPDRHVNGYIRTRWVLTEDNPTIKTYQEKGWAMLEDAHKAPIQSSLLLLESLHQRWVYLLKSLSTEVYERTFFHPEYQTQVDLKTALALYAWHGRHHLAHITSLKERIQW